MSADGIHIAPNGLEYFAPGEVVPGVMWCAHPRRGPEVWSRQLCTALSIVKKSPPKPRKDEPVKPQQLTLF